MTIEELAKHWNVSLNEAQSISDFMNKTFYMATFQKAGDQTFYGAIYEIMKNGSHRLAFTLSADAEHGFKTEQETVETLNRAPNGIKIPDARAKLMGVPQDAFIALKRIKIRDEHSPGRRICSAPSGNQKVTLKSNLHE